mgnify:CR=1 FL=1
MARIRPSGPPESAVVTGGAEAISYQLRIPNARVKQGISKIAQQARADRHYNQDHGCGFNRVEIAKYGRVIDVLAKARIAENYFNDDKTTDQFTCSMIIVIGASKALRTACRKTTRLRGIPLIIAARI